jgi:hypothetical protein
MPSALDRMVGPTQLTNAAATVGTVPASTTWALREILVCNESGAERQFTLSIGADGAGKRLYRNLKIPAEGTLLKLGNTVVKAGEVIQAYADANTALTLSISGVVVT